MYQVIPVSSIVAFVYQCRWCYHQQPTAGHVTFFLCSAQSAFGGKSFIHWTTDEKSEEFFKFDVVDRNAYNEAGTFGKLLGQFWERILNVGKIWVELFAFFFCRQLDLERFSLTAT